MPLAQLIKLMSRPGFLRQSIPHVQVTDADLDDDELQPTNIMRFLVVRRVHNEYQELRRMLCNTKSPLISLLNSNIEAFRMCSAILNVALGVTPEEAAWQLYRLVNKRGRGTRMIVINHNTGSYRDYRCVVCGSIFGSHSTKHERTKQSLLAEDNHVAYETRLILQYSQAIVESLPQSERELFSIGDLE